MARVIREVKPLLAVVVTPMPRYLDPCCEEHEGGRTEEKKTGLVAQSDRTGGAVCNVSY